MQIDGREELERLVGENLRPSLSLFNLAGELFRDGDSTRLIFLKLKKDEITDKEVKLMEWVDCFNFNKNKNIWVGNNTNYGFIFLILIQ